MGYPPGGGSRAIGKLRPSRLVAGPYNDDDVAVQRGYMAEAPPRDRRSSSQRVLTLAFWSPQRSPASCIGPRYGTAIQVFLR